MDTDNREFIEKVEKAAHEGAKQGAKEALAGVKIPSSKGLSFGTIILIIALLIVAAFALWQVKKINSLKEQFSTEVPVEGHDLTLDNNGIWGYKAADFEEVFLGDSQKLKKLEVFSQDMSEMVKLTKTGFANIGLFTKSKFYVYHGTAVYTVNLQNLSTDSIEVDNKNKTITLYIPHTEISEINIPMEDVEIGDTTKGLLAFGDLNATDEESQQISAEARANMEQKLEEEKVQETADRLAVLTVWEIYQPLITNVAPGANLKIEFED